MNEVLVTGSCIHVLRITTGCAGLVRLTNLSDGYERFSDHGYFLLGSFPSH